MDRDAERLEAVLEAWRADVWSEPIPDLITTDEAVALILDSLPGHDTPA